MCFFAGGGSGCGCLVVEVGYGLVFLWVASSCPTKDCIVVALGGPACSVSRIHQVFEWIHPSPNAMSSQPQRFRLSGGVIHNNTMTSKHRTRTRARTRDQHNTPHTCTPTPSRVQVQGCGKVIDQLVDSRWCVVLVCILLRGLSRFESDGTSGHVLFNVASFVCCCMACGGQMMR